MYTLRVNNKEVTLYDGKSAFELAKDQGYTGTLDEWLASLKGEPGANGVKGDQGKSAYDLAIEQGYEGTLDQWLASLKGEKGEEGDATLVEYTGVSGVVVDSANDTIGLTNPTQGVVSKADYDDLLEEEQSKGTYFIFDSETNKITIVSNGQALIFHNVSLEAIGNLISTSNINWDKIVNAPDFALKADLVGLYRYKGAVQEPADLPSDAEVGDTYDVLSSGMNYAWNGTSWDNLGAIFQITPISDEEIDAIFDELEGITNDEGGEE